MNNVGQAGDIGVTLLDNGQSEDRQVHGDDAAADGLALALTSAAGAVAGVAVSEEETDTSRVHDTLLHGETLLVVSTGDAEDVALELVADRVTGDFLTHAAVHEDAELALVFDLDQLLRAIVGVGDVELHLDGGGRDGEAMCCNVSRLVVKSRFRLFSQYCCSIKRVCLVRAVTNEQRLKSGDESLARQGRSTCSCGQEHRVKWNGPCSSTDVVVCFGALL